VAQPATVAAAAALAAIVPSVFEQLIAYSGDVGLTNSARLASAGAAT
jgi:hypothetical protein